MYILKSKKYPQTYVGITTNLSRRLKEHNSHSSRYTSKYKPWTCIYKEEFKSLSEARNREKYFKSSAGRKYIQHKIIPPQFGN